MAYVALYRRYRSQSFEQVIGQPHITAVLRNALRSGRTSHAYLFCGPRGCGKTSTARLLARALNCLSSDGPTPDPCGTCAMCERIAAGSAIDITEMDAASETGVDDVRERIIESAKYSPAEARYKVYIIDEAHDLSMKAFDSLLKTIEEPPAHVVFVLATTESHKVPITIRSRCQRLDFRRGVISDLTHNLERVLTAEGVSATNEAIAAIAQSAEGSFRDSLSILEQVMAFTDGNITADDVHRAVGTVSVEMLDSVLRAVSTDDAPAAFLLAGTMVDTGKDVRQILIGLQAHLRDAIVARMPGDAAGAGVSRDRAAALTAASEGLELADLVVMMQQLAQSERDLRHVNQHRLVLERALWSLLPSVLGVARARAASAARPASAPASASAPSPPAPAPVVTRVGAPPSSHDAPPRPSRIAPVPPPRPPDPEPPAWEPPAAHSAAPGPVDLGVVQRAWDRIHRTILERSASARAVFTDERVVGLEGRFVVIEFPNQFACDRAEKPKARAMVEEVICQVLRVDGLRVRCRIAASEVAPAPGPPPDAGGGGLAETVRDLFGGKIERIDG